ncbi:MAG: ATP-binding protein [Desulfobacterales bacterium]
MNTKLTGSEPDFRQLFDNAPVGIFQTNSTGRANYINRQMAEMVAGSLPESEVPLFSDVGRELYADPARREEFLRIIEEQGEVQGFEYEAVCLDGTHRWFSMNARISERYADGSFLIDGFVADITELKNIQSALEKSRRLLEETQKITKVGGWEYHVETGRLEWTHEVYRIYEVSPEHYEPSEIARDLSFYHPDDRPLIEKAFFMTKTHGTPYDLELRFITAKGRRLWVRTTGNADQEGEKVVRVYGNIMDITARKEAEEKRRHLEQQLQQSQKMEAVGRLAGGIAHDFNNLLSVILGYSEILLGEIPKQEPQREAVEHIHEASVRAKDLTGQLLTFSRSQMLELQIMEINSVIENFESFLRRIIGEDIQLQIELADRPLYAQTDSSRLQQVLMNLVVNARDAMPSGGKLAISTSAGGMEDESASDTSGIQGSCAIITVADNGPGMDEDTLNRIFEPFFTTKQEEGTGLGLAVCYGIIKQHGGDIRVRSRPGEGTSFSIYLPAAESTESEQLEEPAKFGKTGTPAESGARILVVEDDPEVLDLASKILEKNGHLVNSAQSGKAAIELAKNYSGEIHLILTDVIMPEMKGPEVYREISRFHPQIKVLYMSGYTGDGLAGQGITERDREFIQKPFSIRELADKVNRVLSEI